MPCRLAVLALLATAGAASADVLVTVRESNLPNEPSREAKRDIYFGPRVLLVSPSAKRQTVKSPLDLEIRFEARDGVGVDLSTLVVVYVKAPPVDLTERIREFVRPDGISMPTAEIPAGTHHFHVEVKDVEKRLGARDFFITVAP